MLLQEGWRERESRREGGRRRGEDERAGGARDVSACAAGHVHTHVVHTQMAQTCVPLTLQPASLIWVAVIRHLSSRFEQLDVYLV